MQLLLIRHGQSQANVDKIIQGDDDPLTDLGRQQADLVGQHLSSTRELTHLYSSPLARARETAEIIGRHVGLQPSFESGLAEINAGNAVGMTWDAWTEAHPEIAARLRSEDRTLEDRWEGGESGHEFVARVYAAYDHIVGQHLGTDDVVAVVSHGGALAWIASRVHGDPADVWPYQRAAFANCSVSELIIDEKGEAEIGAWNQVEHLMESGDRPLR
jgi:probable phosphoglycerate mutase